jgi:mono/diheme cytochrome c family protein
MQQPLKHYSIAATILVLLLVVGMAIFVYSGSYNMGADAPHTRLTFFVLERLRDRSINAHANSLHVPPLDDPQLILKGAGQYAAMCTECHLAPGKKNSELRAGLYPQPPDLTRVPVEPQRAFWVIKHGIKMSAMPAWGATHEDPTIWSMVAFLRKLPTLTPEEYKDVVSRAPPDEGMEEMKDHMDMPGHELPNH